MATGVAIEIQGLEGTLRNLNQLPKRLKKEIGAEVFFALSQMQEYAQADAPADQGILRQEITVKQLDELNGELVSGAAYSQYVEFGTRSKVQIPPGLQEFGGEVSKTKGASSLTVKEAIFNWCKRKGIPPEAWYPIYISVVVKGISPHPFFFKQVARVEPQLRKNIAAVLDDLAI